MKNVHILNGGFRSWSLKNLPVESYANKRESITSNTLNSNKQNGEESLNKLIAQYEEQAFSSQTTPITYIVDYNYVNDIVQNYDIFAPHYSLIDVASSSSTSHHNHIPTSIWVTDDDDVVENKYTNPDGTMRSGVDILAMWDKAGIDYKRKHLIFYSSKDNNDSNNNEVSAAEVMFYAELMGLYKISVYEGGRREWSRMANNTFQMGPSTDSESISFETPERNDNLFKTTTITTSTSTSHRTTTTTTQTMTSTKRSTTISNNTNMRRNITTANSFFKEQFDRATAPTPPPHLLNNRAACLRSFVFNLIVVVLVVVFFF